MTASSVEIVKRITVINPNSSASMTEQLERECSSLSRQGIELSFITTVHGPASIEGFSDGVRAANALLGVVDKLEREEHTKPSAIVIACFDDTGLDAVRELTTAPVVGIGEAAMHIAALLGRSFIVMTTLARSVPIIERNLDDIGLAKRCSGVFASNVPVLSLEQDPKAYERVLHASRVALKETQGEVLVLGCAGMSAWVERLEADLQVPVIDGVRSAIKLAQGLVELNLKTSKALSYKSPELK